MSVLILNMAQGYKFCEHVHLHKISGISQMLYAYTVSVSVGFPLPSKGMLTYLLLVLRLTSASFFWRKSKVDEILEDCGAHSRENK